MRSLRRDLILAGGIGDSITVPNAAPALGLFLKPLFTCKATTKFMSPAQPKSSSDTSSYVHCVDVILIFGYRFVHQRAL